MPNLPMWFLYALAAMLLVFQALDVGLSMHHMRRQKRDEIRRRSELCFVCFGVKPDPQNPEVQAEVERQLTVRANYISQEAKVWEILDGAQARSGGSQSPLSRVAHFLLDQERAAYKQAIEIADRCGFCTKAVPVIA